MVIEKTHIPLKYVMVLPGKWQLHDFIDRCVIGNIRMLNYAETLGGKTMLYFFAMDHHRVIKKGELKEIILIISCLDYAVTEYPIKHLDKNPWILADLGRYDFQNNAHGDGFPIRLVHLEGEPHLVAQAEINKVLHSS